jgi:hypothetical protein
MDGSLPGRVRSLHQDGPLGRWRIDLCAPCAALAAQVDLLWYGEGRVAYQRDRILPTGGAYVLINLGPAQYRIEPGPPERRIPLRRHLVPGAAHRPDRCRGRRTAMPCLASPCVPADRMPGSAPAPTPLSTAPCRWRIWSGRRPRPCASACSMPADATTRFELVEDWLLRRLHPRRNTHAVVEWARGTNRGRRRAAGHGRAGAGVGLQPQTPG